MLIQELQARVEQKDPGVDLSRLARLEWAYLGFLDGHPTCPVTLHAKLRDDPDFFVEVLGLIFRPKNEPAEGSKEVSEEERQCAQNAYRLLMSWRDVPGSREGQAVDEKTLFDWVQKWRVLGQGCQVFSKSVMNGSDRRSLTPPKLKTRLLAPAYR